MILAPSCRLADKLPSQFSNACFQTLRKQSPFKPNNTPSKLFQFNHPTYAVISSSSFTTVTSQPKHCSHILPYKSSPSFSPPSSSSSSNAAATFSFFAPIRFSNTPTSKHKKSPRVPRHESTPLYQVARDLTSTKNRLKQHQQKLKELQKETEEYNNDNDNDDSTTLHKPEVYYPSTNTLLPHEDLSEVLKKEDAANNALRTARNYLFLILLAYAVCTYIVVHKQPEFLGEKLGEWFDVDYNHAVFRGCRNMEEKYRVVVRRFFTYSVVDYVDPEATIFGGGGRSSSSAKRGMEGEKMFGDDGNEIKTGREAGGGKQIGFGRNTMTWSITPFQTILPILSHGSAIHLLMNSLATFVSVKPLVAIFGVRQTLIWMPLMFAWVSGWVPVLYERCFNQELKPTVVLADGSLRSRTFEELSERFMYLIRKKEGVVVQGGNSPMAVYQQQQQQQQQQQLNKDGGNGVKGGNGKEQTPVETLLYGENLHKHLTDSERHELARLQRLLNSNLGSSGIVCGMLAVHAVMQTPVRFGLTQKLSASPKNFLLALTTWAAYVTIRDEPSAVGHLGHVGGIVAGVIAAVVLKRVGFRPLHEYRFIFR